MNNKLIQCFHTYKEACENINKYAHTIFKKKTSAVRDKLKKYKHSKICPISSEPT